MSRTESILKFIDRQGRGIEVGPWFNPLVPRANGFQSYVVDVFDTDELRRRAEGDENIPREKIRDIEPVDFVGSCTHIDEVVLASKPDFEPLDYIVSSHNFEHLPNPIRFLQGCSRLLKDNGILSMAIPDHRTCFDFFRPVTMIHEWIDAFVYRREKPTLVQNFSHRACFAHARIDSITQFSFFRDTDVKSIRPPDNLKQAYTDLVARIESLSEEYYDSHCSVFTPSSFDLLILDGQHLGLIPFTAVETFDAGCEFHAHLRYCGSSPSMSDAEFLEKRAQLLHSIHDEVAESAAAYRALKACVRNADVH